MKQAIIFILVTTAFILLANTYFEYFISRECKTIYITAASVVMSILAIAYVVYVVQLILKLLKLK
jgi:hypothetical protein